MKRKIFFKKTACGHLKTKTENNVNLRTIELPFASSSTENVRLRTVTATTNSA